MNLYFDNASTSYPKPQAVGVAITHYLSECGGTYGRGFYPRVAKATALVERCRDKLGGILGVSPENVFFNSGATMAANLVLKGLEFKSGAKILFSGMEHNAVMRPLEFISKQTRLELIQLPTESDGRVAIDKIDASMLDNVALIIVNHQSNVNGVIQPVVELMRLAEDIPLMLDATQSISAKGLPGFSANDKRPEYIIFSGHKGLYGPTGIGGLYVAAPDLLTPLLHGGTGSNSEYYEMPEVYPDRLEGGTHNIVGIAGLEAAISSPPEIKHSRNDFLKLLDRVSAIDGVTVLKANLPEHQGEVFSILHSRISPDELAWQLLDSFGCDTRVGLHCAPLAHHTLGTFPDGAVRISLSGFHTVEDLEFLAQAILKISEQ